MEIGYHFYKMENIRQIRSSRTTTEQLETYLCFLEENPQFNAGKNTPENNKYLEEKWEELVGKLNSLKGPLKNAKEWKTSLTHWKYEVKSRARKIREQILLTGGGEPSTTSLSGIEERALNLFGVVTVRGDDAIPIMGFANINQTGAEENAVSDSTLAVTTNPVIPMNPVMESTNSITDSIQSSPIAGPSTVNRPRKRHYSNASSAISECVGKIERLAEDRMKQDKEMAERRLSIDQQNADAMTKMAEALFILAKHIKNK